MEALKILTAAVVATFAVVELFFIFLMVVHNTPFETFLAQAPGALRLQRQCAHAAAHGAALVHGHAANVVHRVQRRRAHDFRQRGEPGW